MDIPDSCAVLKIHHSDIDKLRYLPNVQILKKYYVYEFWDSFKNEPFYVGKSMIRQDTARYKRYEMHFRISFGLNRCNDKNWHKRNRINKILKLGGEILIKIVFQSDDETKVLNKEKELITLYGRRDLKTGSLTNMTDGGEGVSGRVFSKKQIEAIKKRVAGTGNPMYGKHHTEKAKKSIREAHLGKPGHKHTEIWKQKLRKDSPGGKATSKPIYQIDTEGNVIKLWESANKAAKFFGASKGNLCVSTNKPHLISGFYWRLKSEAEIIDGKLSNINTLNKNRLKPHNCRKIAQCDLSGNLIKEWESCLEVKRATGFSNSILSNILLEKRKNNVYKGFIWKNYEIFYQG